MRVVVGSEKMERDIRSITHDPTIVTGRPRWNVKEHSGAEFVDRTVVHRRCSTTGKYQSHMLDVTARRPDAGPDVKGPLPSRLVRGPANGHAPDADKFEFSFFERSHLVGLFKTFQNRFDVRHEFRSTPAGNEHCGLRSGANKS